MHITSTRLIYFSPTGTTRKVLQSIAQGVGVAPVAHLDLTLPGPPVHADLERHEELVIMGAPVYGGRLPADMISRVRRLKGRDTPAVVVVVYGNRAYEDALLELRDLALERGFAPLAAGAFVGEHSYSSEATPIAVGRPDEQDVRKAQEFGRAIRERVGTMRSPDDTLPLRVPGNFPYRKLRMLSEIAPVTYGSVCTQCGTCASVCPAGAITVRDRVETDRSACIRCCACVRRCPAEARSMEDHRIRQVAQQLSVTCRERNEPETYL